MGFVSSAYRDPRFSSASSTQRTRRLRPRNQPAEDHPHPDPKAQLFLRSPSSAAGPLSALSPDVLGSHDGTSCFGSSDGRVIVVIVFFHIADKFFARGSRSPLDKAGRGHP